MFRRSKRAFSMFVACAMLLSIIGSAVDAAVATLLSPTPGAAGGKIVDVSVKFDSQSAVKIDTVVLYIDNIVYEKKKLSTPAKQGVVSFDWDTQAFAKGQHYIEVRLFANNKLVTAVNGTGIVADSVFDVNPPKVELANVVDGETISGSKVIRINAKDDSGESPIVSLLVDKKLKLMQNTQPFSYTLDTTAMEDGKHVIEVYAFDVEGNQSDIMTYTINVNNGGAGSETKVAKIETVKTTPIDLGTPKSVTDGETIAARPTLSTSPNTEVGRISDSEISASIDTVKTTPIITTNSEGILSSANTEKPSVSEPIMVSKVNSIPVGNEEGLKIATLSTSKGADVALNTPKTVVEEAKSITIAKKISDNNIVNSELKLVTDQTIAETTLNTPKVVDATPKAEATPTKDVEVKIAKNVSNNSISDESLKLSADPSKSTYDLDVPNIKTDKPILVAKAATVKASVKPAPKPTTYIAATGKAKLRDVVNAQNGTLLWDNKTKTVTAYVNNCKVEMRIGSKKAKVNGNPVVVNLVPKIQKGRTIIDVTEFNRILETPSLKK